MQTTNRKLYAWSLIVALAGFLFGFDTVVISGADQSLASLWSSYTLGGKSSAFHGVVVMSSALWGTVIGAALGAFPTDRLGRKKTLFYIGVLYFVSALGSAFANDPYLFAVFRFLGGIGVGVSTIAAPAYVSEISPAKDRGRLVALYQFNIVFGILVAFASNYFISSLFSGPNAWRVMLGAEAIPALAYLLLITRVPRSPRWLLGRGRTAEAKNILSLLHDTAVNIDEMIEDLDRASASESSETVFQKKYCTQLWLVIALAAFNQFSGINAFLYYSPRIFEMAGLAANAALLSSIGVGAVNLIFTLIGLSLIDKSGRKKLMIVGSLGYILSLGLVTYSFATDWLGLHVTFFFFLFIASHAVGQGAVIWVFISEIFPNKQRAQGQAVGTSTHWILAAIIPALVPLLFSTIGASTVFAIFTAMMVLQLVWVLAVMPETKGVSLEDLSKSLGQYERTINK
jgi:sugar porter (SP) family MFS transporter